VYNNGEVFKINIINQWKLEKLYKVMSMNKDAKVKFIKKTFMLMINKFSNENCVKIHIFDLIVKDA
jgi:hypothetical protein